MVKRRERVTQFLCGRGNAFRRTDDEQLIRKLHADIKAPGELESATRHTAHGHAKAVIERKLLDALAKNSLVRHENRLDRQIRLLERNGRFLFFANNFLQAFNRIRHSDNMHQVMELKRHIALRHVNHLIASMARYHSTRRDEPRNVLNFATHKIYVIHTERARDNFLGLFCDFFLVFRSSDFRLLPKEQAHKNHHKNNANHAERVSHRIANARE